MLSLISLVLIPALAWAADPAASNTTSTPAVGASNATAAVTANAAALPACALTCTVQTAPSTPCMDPANLTCSCTNMEFQQKALACYKTSCSASDLNITLTVGASMCATSGHALTSSTGAASNASNTTGSMAVANAANVTHATSNSHNVSASADGKTASASVSRSGSNSGSNSGSHSQFQVSTGLATFAFGATVYFASF